MAIRVTADEVKAILETSSYSVNFDLTPFILVASLQTDNITGLDDDLLKEIERWLAAHYATVRHRRPVEEAYDDARHRYAEHRGTGLASTEFGQMAMELDTSGSLINSSKPKASFTVFDVLNG